MDLKIELAGDVQLSRKLLRFGEKAKDASPAFRQMIDALVLDERQQFNTQGQYASGGWKPLADATVKLKAERSLDPRILRATGDLYRSLATKRAKSAVRQAGKQEMVFGTTVPYAKFHQRGTSRMPQRRPLELREQDRRTMVRLLQAHLLEEFT